MITQFPRWHREKQTVIAVNQLDVTNDKRVIERQGAEGFKATSATCAQIDSNLRQMHGAPPGCMKRCVSPRTRRKIPPDMRPNGPADFALQGVQRFSLTISTPLGRNLFPSSRGVTNLSDVVSQLRAKLNCHCFYRQHATNTPSRFNGGGFIVIKREQRTSTATHSHRPLQLSLKSTSQFT